MASKPPILPTWTQGDPSQVAQPPAAQMASGWTAGQPPVAQWMNWLQWQNGQWLSYLSEQTNQAQVSAALDPSIRLAGGGVWSFVLSSTTLSWSQPFYLLTPGLSDLANVCAASSVTLASGQVAYVNANLPFSSQGDISSGSPTVTNLTYQSGITAGMTVTGGGIPASTTVLSVSSGQLTLSNNATTSQSAQALTFVSSGALTIQVAQESSLQLSPNTVIVARGLAQTVLLGVNAGVMTLRNGEQKYLHEAGYLCVARAKAGQALSVGQAVYMSIGAADGNRTAAAVYPVDASAANGATRSGFLGIVYGGGNAGDLCGLVTEGVATGFTGLVPGAVYYADTQTPGAIAAARPTQTNTYAVPVGTALSPTMLAINPARGATAVQVQSSNPWPNYGVGSEAQLQTALAAANSSGGVIILTASFTINQVYAVGSYVIIQGRKSNTVVTVAANASLQLGGDGAEVRDVWFQTSAPIACLTVSGNYNIVRGSAFMLSGGNNNGVLVTGSANRFMQNHLYGTAASSSAYGINYAAGADNTDNDTVVVS